MCFGYVTCLVKKQYHQLISKTYHNQLKNQMVKCLQISANNTILFRMTIFQTTLMVLFMCVTSLHALRFVAHRFTPRLNALRHQLR
jgi:hypothetical protein